MHAIALPYRQGAPSHKYSNRAPWWLPVETVLRSLDPAGG
jgi:hypothetical protein